MSHTIHTVERYHLLIEGDLLKLVRQAMALEKGLIKAKDYQAKKVEIENKLYDLYQEIGWSVTYQMDELPF